VLLTTAVAPETETLKSMMRSIPVLKLSPLPLSKSIPFYAKIKHKISLFEIIHRKILPKEKNVCLKPDFIFPCKLQLF
jgi:hypothetical protein